MLDNHQLLRILLSSVLTRHTCMDVARQMWLFSVSIVDDCIVYSSGMIYEISWKRYDMFVGNAELITVCNCIKLTQNTPTDFHIVSIPWHQLRIKENFDEFFVIKCNAMQDRTGQDKTRQARQHSTAQHNTTHHNII